MRQRLASAVALTLGIVCFGRPLLAKERVYQLVTRFAAPEAVRAIACAADWGPLESSGMPTAVAGPVDS